jgi:hypothetical protein
VSPATAYTVTSFFMLGEEKVTLAMEISLVDHGKSPPGMLIGKQCDQRMMS